MAALRKLNNVVHILSGADLRQPVLLTAALCCRAVVAGATDAATGLKGPVRSHEDGTSAAHAQRGTTLRAVITRANASRSGRGAVVVVRWE